MCAHVPFFSCQLVHGGLSFQAFSDTLRAVPPFPDPHLDSQALCGQGSKHRYTHSYLHMYSVRGKKKETGARIV